MAQVRALALPTPANNQAWHCGAPVAGWDSLTAAPGARLAARAEPQLAATSVCDIAASAGYRRLENQYREIHSVDANTGAATFKWSRENASVAYAVQSVTIDSVAQQTIVRVAARGRDANLDLSPHRPRGAARRCERAGATRRPAVRVSARRRRRAGAGARRSAPEQPWARTPAATRCCGAGSSAPCRRPARAGRGRGRLDSPGRRRAGALCPRRQLPRGRLLADPARTATADVEWPLDEDGAPQARPPAGVRDGWARLGLVTVDAGGLISAITDCREWFPPLTQLTQLLCVGGDGQEAAPNTTLAEPLRLRVARGALPLAGSRVRFTLEAGGGSVNPRGHDRCAGLAQCNWQLGGAGPQRVRANLLTSGGAAVPEQTLVFSAMAQAPAQAGGGCCITIGKGGDFEQLSTELLMKLLEEHGGQLCLCLLPGTHELADLTVNQVPPGARLSLHGCGPTAIVAVHAPIALGGFAALELRDLQLAMDPGTSLQLTATANWACTACACGESRISPSPGSWWTAAASCACTVRGGGGGAGLGGAAEHHRAMRGHALRDRWRPGVLWHAAARRHGLGTYRNGSGECVDQRRLQVPAGRGQLVLGHNRLRRLNLGEEMPGS